MTNVRQWRTIQEYGPAVAHTMAEVAAIISTRPVWQSPDGERDGPPKALSCAERIPPGPVAEHARDCHRKCDGAQTRDIACIVPVSDDMGISIFDEKEEREL